jgi:hypothetical protein
MSEKFALALVAAAGFVTAIVANAASASSLDGNHNVSKSIKVDVKPRIDLDAKLKKSLRHDILRYRYGGPYHRGP